MLKADGTGERALPLTVIDSDLVVIGGGLAGVCCAITAARAGIKVVLVQDRSVLGGQLQQRGKVVDIGRYLAHG
jgi:heterodisulfide reductase subunit A-like polyferredoxin